MSKPSLKERFKRLMREYGRIALVVYFSIFAVVYLGFLTTLSAGIGETSTAGTVGTATAAWLATKVTQPLRIGATFMLTPLVAKLVRRAPLDPALGSSEDAAGAAAENAENENGAADGDADSAE